MSEQRDLHVLVLMDDQLDLGRHHRVDEHAERHGVDVVVVDAASPSWVKRAQATRRQDARLRVVAIIKDLGTACEAVNSGLADLLVESSESLAPLLDRLAVREPVTGWQLEQLVSHRTATLEQIKAQWEQTIDAMADPVAVLDADYRLIRGNLAFASTVGEGITTAPGHHCFALRDASSAPFSRDEGQPCIGCPVKTARESDRPASAVLSDISGQRWSVSCYPTTIAGAPGSVVVHYRNATVEMDHVAKAARENKMSAVGSLAGAIAHELNSPMTSIMVFSEALARKTDEGSELHENAMQVQESAQRCRRLIHGLLRFARRPKGREMGVVNLLQVISEVHPLVGHRIAVSRIDFSLQLDDQLPAVRGHHADVEHLLVDLLVNAIEACAPGDAITIEARAVDRDQVELIVRDTGRGMSPESLALAFEPFYSTKPRDQGTGLGLSTCEAIVAEMGGTIALASTLGEGTSAVVRIPAVR